MVSKGLASGQQLPLQHWLLFDSLIREWLHPFLGPPLFPEEKHGPPVLVALAQGALMKLNLKHVVFAGIALRLETPRPQFHTQSINLWQWVVLSGPGPRT